MKPWLAALCASGMGLLWAGSFLAYAYAFKAIGALQLTPTYFWKLAWSTPFIPGLVLSLGVSFLRMWLFGQVGPQRTWFLEPVINVAGTLVEIGVLRESMRGSQWAGAIAVTAGMFLLVRR